MAKMMMSVFFIVLAASLLDGTEAVPTFPVASAMASVPENATVGTSVYKINITGTTGTVTYAITGADNADTVFEVAADGLVKVKTASLDHEGTASYTLTITATETGVSDPALKLTVTVTNVAPSFTSPPAAVDLTDRSADGATVGTFAATDPGNTAVTISLACGNTNSDFAIDTTSGAMTVAPGRTIDDARTSCYTLVLHAADTATPALTGTATVVVTVKGGQNSVTCKANSNPCNKSGATLLAVPMFVMLLCWILSNILK